MFEEKDHKKFQKFLEQEGISGRNPRAANRRILIDNNRKHREESKGKKSILIYLLIPLMAVFFILLFLASCEKIECEPKCEKNYGLVTYWLRFPATGDTIHFTNIGYKDCEGKYWKLSEPTVTNVDDRILVDTAFANEIYFNFVRFKPFPK
jgi:hypothetical protein